MTEFTKLKMGFSVALLAALFMLRPLIEPLTSSGGIHVLLFGLQIKLQALYYLFAGALGLSAYFFALELLSGKSTAPFAQKAGNTTYALAILMPPAFVAIWTIGQSTAALRKHSGSDALALAFSIALTALAGAAALGVLFYIRQAMSERDRSFTVSRLADEETEQMAKANGLLEAGLYDLAVIQCFQTIETALRRVLLARGGVASYASMKDMLALAHKRKLLDDEDRRRIHDLRVLRNEVAHEAKEVDRNTAEEVIEATRRVVTRLGMLLDAADNGNGGETADETKG